MRHDLEGRHPALLVERNIGWYESTPLCEAWRDWAAIVARRYGRAAGEETHDNCSRAGHTMRWCIENGRLDASVARIFCGVPHVRRRKPTKPYYTGVRKGAL